MALKKENLSGRRTFLGRACAAAAALTASATVPGRVLALTRSTQVRPAGTIATVWIVDFLTVSGRIIKPFANEEEAKKYVAKLIAREIEAGQVRQPAAIQQRIAANDLDGAIAAYQEDQRKRAFGGEVAVLEERIA